MKIRIALKDPDGVQDSVEAAVARSVSEIPNLSERERKVLIEERTDELDLSRWVKWGEYVTIEVDTEARTAIVVPTAD